MEVLRRKGLGRERRGNDIHLESMPLNESLSKPKYPMGW